MVSSWRAARALCALRAALSWGNKYGGKGRYSNVKSAGLTGIGSVVEDEGPTEGRPLADVQKDRKSRVPMSQECQKRTVPTRLLFPSEAGDKLWSFPLAVFA